MNLLCKLHDTEAFGVVKPSLVGLGPGGIFGLRVEVVGEPAQSVSACSDLI